MMDIVGVGGAGGIMALPDGVIWRGRILALGVAAVLDALKGAEDAAFAAR